MDLIEHAIHCLAFQAEAIAEAIPNDPETVAILGEGAKALHRAAGARHAYRSATDGLDDDTYEAQRRQLDQAEAYLAEEGIRATIDAAPLSPSDDEKPTASS